MPFRRADFVRQGIPLDGLWKEETACRGSSDRDRIGTGLHFCGFQHGVYGLRAGLLLRGHAALRLEGTSYPKKRGILLYGMELSFDRNRDADCHADGRSDLRQRTWSNFGMRVYAVLSMRNAARPVSGKEFFDLEAGDKKSLSCGEAEAPLLLQRDGGIHAAFQLSVFWERNRKPAPI